MNELLKKSFLIIALTITVNISALDIIKLNISLEYPWGMTWIDPTTMLITQKNGKLFLINTENESKIEIDHNIPLVNVGQGGLLDVISENNDIWLTSTIKKNEKYTTAVYYAKLKGNKLTNLKLLYEVTPYSVNTIHFGSRIELKDDYLYITIGERGEGILAQDGTNSIGSIIKIKKDGTIINNDKNNEHANWLPELFQMGVRNPQGISTDPLTDKIYISNHGPKGGDFIGPVIYGSNYGWNKVAWGGTNYNGTKVGNGKAWEPGFLKPSYTWVPSIGVGGIKFYKGDAFPQWNNQLLVASLKFKYLSVLYREDKKFIKEEIILRDKIGRIRDIEINNRGEIFLIADEQNTFLYKLVP
ncbi:PQQ-dependent sugar dehydrogenase [Spirochaeta cellobiosiphila]|uniref:PQQ-dependent sugar dehydrogenase n=1 Tax=Spirochaeta cellobiosiphila TaxID=504483 RepID=UPI0004099C4A|nr:PQQ-dependent sugar dehydrogenase [Spirochaeta cellobiosiphila]